MGALIEMQREICRRFGVEFCPAHNGQKVGIAANVRTRLMPINGLRHPASGDTTGWYIWAGEQMSNSPDFFMPLHVEHLDEWCPDIQKYLALPPGWRFLVAENQEEIWFDEKLFDV